MWCAWQGLCSKQGVSGYPTIKYYMQGEKEGKSYSGGRSLEALKTFTVHRPITPATPYRRI